MDGFVPIVPSSDQATVQHESLNYPIPQDPSFDIQDDLTTTSLTSTTIKGPIFTTPCTTKAPRKCWLPPYDATPTDFCCLVVILGNTHPIVLGNSIAVFHLWTYFNGSWLSRMDDGLAAIKLEDKFF